MEELKGMLLARGYNCAMIDQCIANAKSMAREELHFFTRFSETRMKKGYST